MLCVWVRLACCTHQTECEGIETEMPVKGSHRAVRCGSAQLSSAGLHYSAAGCCVGRISARPISSLVSSLQFHMVVRWSRCKCTDSLLPGLRFWEPRTEIQPEGSIVYLFRASRPAPAGGFPTTVGHFSVMSVLRYIKCCCSRLLLGVSSR